MMPTKALTIIIIFGVSLLWGARLEECSPLDKNYLRLSVSDGEAVFVDDGTGPDAFHGHSFNADNNSLEPFGEPLNTDGALRPQNWTITSSDDSAYSDGMQPDTIFRRSKIDGMAQVSWDSENDDWKYETAMKHTLYLKMPAPLQQGAAYIITPTPDVKIDTSAAALTYDHFTHRSESIHVNLVGYEGGRSAAGADLYAFLGDGGYRDYGPFEGNTVSLVNTADGTVTEVGTVSFGATASENDVGWFNLTGGDVWHIDGATDVPEGTYRLAVEGIGASDTFRIAENIWRDPFAVSLQGFFYMRIGQDSAGISPVPRRPLWIPGEDPQDCRVVLTTMHPFHDEWQTVSEGDSWDNPDAWKPWIKEGSPENPHARGGHSDALDWDRHLGHVSIIWDMLLPVILTEGGLTDDDLGIAESGNGIPDIIDEARNEVDFWLALRDGAGYSHGLTNPDDDNTLYQAGTSALAAWANAVNAAMLAEALRLTGHTELSASYTDSATAAFNHADSRPDNMLDSSQSVGMNGVTGRDLAMTAAAYLYRLTGDTRWEDAMAEHTRITSATAEIDDSKTFSRIWGLAAYVTGDHSVHHPALHEDMIAAVIHQAEQKEAGLADSRPSRRGTDQRTGYFQTIQNMQRTMVAHAVSSGTVQKKFLRALRLEAGWGLGRNPINTIQMTTATTVLQNKRSIENCYTSGRNDGSPGLHPGHTPFLNHDDWAPGLIMGRPSWLTDQCYPSFDQWPKAAGYFNTRYVWAHSEFTPQQTMRGKTALYAYLHALARSGSTGLISQGSGPHSAEDAISLSRHGRRLQLQGVPDGAVLQLFSIDGRRIVETDLAHGGSVESLLPSSLSAGIYLVQINAGSRQISRSLLIN
ncbi:MAG: T9SS type A sorting domain-containing protein [Fibrobacterota bacterium]